MVFINIHSDPGSLYIGELLVSSEYIITTSQDILREQQRGNERETMAGIMNKIGDTLNVGGAKKEGEQKGQTGQYQGERKGQHQGEGQYQGEQKGQYQGERKGEQQGERKEGMVDKVKDKIIGVGVGGGGVGGGGQNKEGKKKHEDGHKSCDSD
ncbi:hypothetical protein I3760_09G167700 [Carya illinoinensis]|nr:hypothetical protein I3760_09G167700 [Carya illinoinensis]